MAIYGGIAVFSNPLTLWNLHIFSALSQNISLKIFSFKNLENCKWAVPLFINHGLMIREDDKA